MKFILNIFIELTQNIAVKNCSILIKRRFSSIQLWCNTKHGRCRNKFVTNLNIILTDSDRQTYYLTLMSPQHISFPFQHFGSRRKKIQFLVVSLHHRVVKESGKSGSFLHSQCPFETWHDYRNSIISASRGMLGKYGHILLEKQIECLIR